MEMPGAYYSKVFQKLYQFSFTLLWPLIPATKLFIIFTMSSAYHDAAKYISFLYLGTVFQSFSSFYGVGYLRDKNTKQASLTSIYGAITNAAINILLIRFIGLYAASVSTFLGFGAMWLIREHQNHEELGIIIEIKRFLTYFCITVILSTIACVTNPFVDLLLFAVGSSSVLHNQLSYDYVDYHSIVEKAQNYTK